jgi:hypothetical protein
MEVEQLLSLSGPALAQAISSLLETPGLYVFSDILELPNVREVTHTLACKHTHTHTQTSTQSQLFSRHSCSQGTALTGGGIARDPNKPLLSVPPTHLLLLLYLKLETGPHAPVYQLLNLFAYGTYCDYKGTSVAGSGAV